MNVVSNRKGSCIDLGNWPENYEVKVWPQGRHFSQERQIESFVDHSIKACSWFRN